MKTFFNDKKPPNKKVNLPKILDYYIDSDFITQMKANFFYKVGIAAFIFLCLLVLSTCWLQIQYFGGVQPVIIGLELLCILILFLSLFLIVKGKFNIAVHLMINSCFFTVWTVMFSSFNQVLSRFDTIAFTYGILAMTPLVTNNNKKSLLIYTTLNIITLSIFVNFLHSEIELQNGQLIDYFIDNSIAYILTSIIVYNLFAIYQKAVDRLKIEHDNTLNAESEVITLNNELEEKVKARTEELENTLRELNRFAYLVSHDLKAPLRGIGQISEWLVEDYKEELDQNGQDTLKLLTGRVAKLEEMIDGILHYSRIGRKVIEYSEIDLDASINDIIDLLLPPENIKISIKDSLPVITADQTRIEQLFQNLIQNAIKFSDKAEGAITISHKDLGDFWEFTVADNGPGIDEKNRELVFDLFKTIDTKDDTDSTGIGLSIVKKIVELFGGTIFIESAPGKGSSFIFTIKKIVKN